MSRSLADALEKLLVAGGRLAASQLTAAQRGALEEFARRTLAVRLSVSGRGSLYQIAALEQVQAHLAAVYQGCVAPDHPGRLQLLDALPARRGGQADLGGDLLHGLARVALQFLQNQQAGGIKCEILMHD